MWSLEKIIVRNILSFGEAEWVVRNNALTLVTGENQDNEGANSNGSGKSSLLEALTLGMLGTTYRDLTMAEVIRDGESKASVQVSLTNAMTSDKLEIHRQVSKSKSSTLDVVLNGENKRDRVTSPDEGNKYILELLGVTRDDIYNYYVVHQGNSHDFLTATDGEKKKIISRFANMDSVVQAESAAKERLGQATEQVRLGESRRMSAETAYNQARNILAREQQAVQHDIQPVVDGYLDQARLQDAYAAQCGVDIEAALARVADFLVEIETKKEEVKQQESKIPSDADIVHEMREANTTLTKEKQALDKINRDIGLFQRLVAGAVCCPQCFHHFVPQEGDEAAMDVAELQSLIKDAENAYKDKQRGIGLIEERLSTLNGNRRSIAAQHEALDHQKRQLKDMQVNYNGHQSHVMRLKDAQVAAIRQAESIRLRAENVRLEAMKERSFIAIEQDIENWDAEVKRLDHVLAADRQKRDFAATLHHHLGRAGFQHYLMRQVIEHLQLAINQQLQRFATDMAVEIKAFTAINKGKAMNDKIDVIVHRRGHTHSIDRLSGGEKNRLQLAAVIAVQHLLNMSAGDGKGLNLLVFDETFENLDESGQRELMRCLQGLSQTTVCISHALFQEIDPSSSHVLVVKRGGVSMIQRQ